MRDYGKVSPQFWTGKTGKSLRGHAEAQIVALYLMTSPHSTMIGVFHLPKLYLAHETGLGMEAVEAGLARCIAAGFCAYDEDTETVFVVEMAAHQVGETLKPNDLRAKGLHRQYAAIAGTVLGDAFHARYGDAFDLPSKPLASPLQAPSDEGKGAIKPHSPAPVASKKKSKAPECTLAEWLDALDGTEVIPADDPLFGWATTAQIPREWVALAWWAFEARYAEQAKRYADWRAVFRRAVREDWLKLWRVDRDGRYVLTTAGEAVRREMEAAA